MGEATPSEVASIDFVRRWSDIVERRRIQMDAAYAASGMDSSDYWAKRAKAYRHALHERINEDPFLRRLREVVTPDSSVLDVGAGTGRHTLALAPHVRHITAIDPSAAMLAFLREDLAAQGITNVDAIEADWLRTEVQPADYVICSHVLYPIADVTPFIERLAGHATKGVYVYLRLDPMPTDMGLWAEFYGVPLQAQPSSLDLLNLLAQIGIAADYEVVEHRFSWTFGDVEEGVSQLRNTLCLPENDDAATLKLRRLLEERLVAWPNGRLGPQVGSVRSAIVSWVPRED